MKRPRNHAIHFVRTHRDLFTGGLVIREAFCGRRIKESTAITNRRCATTCKACIAVLAADDRRARLALGRMGRA
jgi:hypothetical protein